MNLSVYCLQVSLEVFPEPRGGGAATLAEAAVLKLINPAAEIGGDARLELPPASRIKTEQQEIDGKVKRSWNARLGQRAKCQL